MERMSSMWGKALQENQNVGLKSDTVCSVADICGYNTTQRYLYPRIESRDQNRDSPYRISVPPGTCGYGCFTFPDASISAQRWIPKEAEKQEELKQTGLFPDFCPGHV